jgi:hypothetical protein
LFLSVLPLRLLRTTQGFLPWVVCSMVGLVAGCGRPDEIPPAPAQPVMEEPLSQIVPPAPPPAPQPAEDWLRPSTVAELPAWMSAPATGAWSGACGIAAPRPVESGADQRDRAARTARQQLAQVVAQATIAVLDQWAASRSEPPGAWTTTAPDVARLAASAAVRSSLIGEQWTNPRNGELAVRVTVAPPAAEVVEAVLAGVATASGLEAGTRIAFANWAKSGQLATALTARLGAHPTQP